MDTLDSKKHAERRYGETCSECGKSLGAFRLEGSRDGQSLVFCSFNCMDADADRRNPPKAVV